MSSTIQSGTKEGEDTDLISNVSGYVSHISSSLLAGNELQLLFLITILATFLRIYQLGTESLWLDEATTYIFSSESLHQVLERTSTDVHPPLYYIVVHFFLYIGNSEAILRLPSMIIGVLSIPVLFFFTERMFSSKEALISSFLLSVSLMHIYYSQEARMYSMLLFFTLCSLYFFYLALEDNKRLNWVFFVFFTLLNIYTHYFGFFIFPIEILFYLLTQVSYTREGTGSFPFVIMDKEKFKEFALSVFVVVLLIIPRIQVFLEQSTSKVGGEVTWGLGQAHFIPIVLARFSTFSSSQSILFLSLFLIGIIAVVIYNKRQALLLGMWFILPFMVSFYLAGIMPFQPRYLIFLLPAFLIVVSRGITAIPPLVFPEKVPSKKGAKTHNGNDNVRSKQVALAAGIVLILFLSSAGSLTDYYSTSQKNDWREVSSFIESSSQSGDVVVPLPSYMSQPLIYYYDNSSDGTYIVNVGYTSAELDDVVSSTSPNKVFFVLTGDINAANPEGTALAWIQEHAYVASVINGVYILIPNT